MKTLSFILLFLYSVSIMAQDLIVPVINVRDGDTIEIRLTLPEPLDKVSVRLYGIDTPEIPAASYAITGKLSRAKCIQEAEMGLAARDMVRDLVDNNGGILLLKGMSWDKYGGRIDADVYVLDIKTGVETYIADRLIIAKLAVPYYGGTKNKDWCE